MRQKLSSWERHIGERLVSIRVPLLISLGFVVVIALIIVGYWFDWTGFNQSIGPQLQANQQYRPGKTLWDWLQLLIIPAVLAFGAIWFNHSERKSEQKIASDSQQETALQAYLDRLSELLMKEGLRISKRGDEVRMVARVRTLAILRQLDEDRKTHVIRFLYESDLINGGSDRRIIDLAGADLNKAIFFDSQGTDLKGINLSGAELNFADFTLANFNEADFSGAQMIGSEFFQADLQKANFYDANLAYVKWNKANAGKADLRKVFFGRADLSNADLSEAKLNDADLSEAKLVRVELAKGDLSRANLCKTDLRDADLSEANLSDANLDDADLRGAKLENANVRGATITNKTKLNAHTLTPEQIKMLKTTGTDVGR